MSFVKGQHALGSDSLSSCFSPHTWTATHVLCVVEVVVYVLKTAVGARDTSRERFSRSARLGIQGTARPAWCPQTRQPALVSEAQTRQLSPPWCRSRRSGPSRWPRRRGACGWGGRQGPSRARCARQESRRSSGSNAPVEKAGEGGRRREKAGGGVRWCEKRSKYCGGRVRLGSGFVTSLAWAPSRRALTSKSLMN